MTAVHPFFRSDIRTILVTSVWLFTCLQYFVPFLLLLPLKLIPVYGLGMYRVVSGWYDRYGRVACMCVPFSWCGTSITVKGYDSFRRIRTDPDAVILSTHCSRIDWLVGMYLGTLHGLRVGFVAEATVGLYPIIGWSRVLLGDIFVTRAFDKDAPRIERNIAAYQKSKVKRIIFIAPEGYVADPGSAIGDKYISQCDEFMAAEGRPPLTHLLTPRYKGMQAFIKHAPDNVFSCAMAYTEDDAKVDLATGTLVGGRVCSKPLTDPLRTIPDLHSVFRGGLGVVIQTGTVKIDTSDAQTLKTTMLDDQRMKDDMLRHLDETRQLYDDAKMAACYTDTVSPAEHVTPPHVWLNLVLMSHTAMSVTAISFVWGISLNAALAKVLYVIGTILLLHSSTHYGARWATGVESRESLIGETAIKASLELTARTAKRLVSTFRPPRKSKERMGEHGKNGTAHIGKNGKKE